MEVAPRLVAADENNVNQEVHPACSVIEKQDHLRDFRVLTEDG